MKFLEGEAPMFEGRLIILNILKLYLDRENDRDLVLERGVLERAFRPPIVDDGNGDRGVRERDLLRDLGVRDLGVYDRLLDRE